MLSLKQCREIIDPQSQKYTDFQVEAIRTYLTELVKMNVQIFLELREKRGLTNTKTE